MHKLISMIKYIIICFMILLVMLLFVPKLLGWQEYIVKSGSMEPSISVGSIVYLNPVDFADIKEDDVIGYQNGMNIVVHRVVSINKENSFVQTKGDANPNQDDYSVHESLIVGKLLVSIPMLGYLVHFFRSIQGLIVLVFMVVIVVFAMYFEGKGKDEYEKNNR